MVTIQGKLQFVCFFFLNSSQILRRLHLQKDSLLAENRLHRSSATWKETQHLQFPGVVVIYTIFFVINSTWMFQKYGLHAPTTLVQQAIILDVIHLPQFSVSNTTYWLLIHYSLVLNQVNYSPYSSWDSGALDTIFIILWYNQAMYRLGIYMRYRCPNACTFVYV